MVGSLLEAKARLVGILNPVGVECPLLFPEAPSHPGACLQLYPGQAWGYLLEWTLSVPLGASRSLSTVVLIPESFVLTERTPKSGMCPWVPCGIGTGLKLKHL